MNVIKAIIFLAGSAIVFILLIYWLVSKYVDFRIKKDREMSVAKQAHMQENIVTGVILIILITLVAWMYLVSPR